MIDSDTTVVLSCALCQQSCVSLDIDPLSCISREFSSLFDK
jgi:hypothetical protein